MKSPKPNQNKPHHTQTMHGLAIQKLLNKPKKVHHTLLPLRRGKKTTTKIQSVMRPTRRTTPHQWFRHHPTSTHHKTMQTQSHKPTKQNHWHTIEFSHNTRTPKHTPTSRGLLKAACPTLHTPTQQTKSPAMRIKSKDLPALVFLPPSHQNHCPAGRCRSR